MKLSFTLSAEDFLTHQLFVAGNSKRTRRRKIRNWLIIPLLYLLIGYMLRYVLKNETDSLYVFAGVAVIWLFTYPFYFRWLYRRHFSKHIEEHYQERIDVPVEVFFQEEAVVIKSETMESKISLVEIERIYELPAHFFLGTKSGLTLILPKDKIPHAEMKAFIDEASAKTGAGIEDRTEWKWK